MTDPDEWTQILKIYDVDISSIYKESESSIDMKGVNMWYVVTGGSM